MPYDLDYYKRWRKVNRPRKHKWCSSCSVELAGKGGSKRCLECRTKRAVETLEARFFRYVEKTETCWLWKLGLDGGGYGRMRVDGVLHYAHHVSYFITNGCWPPKGKHLHHKVKEGCVGPRCVNHDHLTLLYPKEHVHADGTCPAALNAIKTHCKHGHPLSGDNIRKVKAGRSCWVCVRAYRLKRRKVKQAYNKIYYERNKESILERNRMLYAKKMENYKPAITLIAPSKPL